MYEKSHGARASSSTLFISSNVILNVVRKVCSRSPTEQIFIAPSSLRERQTMIPSQYLKGKKENTLRRVAPDSVKTP